MTKDTATEPVTFHRNLRDNDMQPVVSLLYTLAEIKGVDETDLPPLHQSVGDLVECFFRSAAEATAELTFSYEGYRITIYQDGHVVFQQLNRE